MSKAPPVEVLSRKIIFDEFLKLETFTLRTRNFDGSTTEPYFRAIFSTGQTGAAVVVLPYDPVTDQVVLTEQFRLPAYLVDENRGWVIETVAGLIDIGETPEQTLPREMQEEAGLTPRRIQKVATYMPSPGAFTEVIHLYICEVTAGANGGIHGMEGEHEDIRTHIVNFEKALQMADNGEIINGNLLLAMNWLARNHDKLRKRWLAD